MTQPPHPATLADLKAGDEVVVISSGVRNWYGLRTVVRVTPHQVHLDNGNRYHKAGGHRLGYASNWISVAEEDFAEARKQEHARVRVAETEREKVRQEERKTAETRRRGALERVKHYLLMRHEHPTAGESIHGVHVGTEFAAELNLSDLTEVVALAGKL